MFQQFVVPFVTFIAGAFVGTAIGWFAHKHYTKTELANWERSFITVIVTMAWVVSVILDIALDSYETPVAVHGVMGVVAGYFFESSLFNKKE